MGNSKIIVGRAKARHFAKQGRVVVVAGPTASGKSDLAIELARRFNGEIISADSRQVYRGMDIGTGKVTKREQKLVRHWMLDVASPTRQYSVARFKREAQKAIRDITRRGKLPIICGGTGLYIDTLVYDISLPEVKPNIKLRAKLSKLSTTKLYDKLLALDPRRASSIDRRNPRRLVRALEIVLVSGRPVSQVRLKAKSYKLLYLALNSNPVILRRRITKRLDARLRHGMITEVKKLHASGISWHRLESFGLEYRWLARYLKSQAKSYKLKAISYQEMRQHLLSDIVRYSKRQMTWFRNNKDVVWITHPVQAVQLVQQFVALE